MLWPLSLAIGKDLVDWELMGGEFVILIYFCFFGDLGLGAFSYSFVVFAGRFVSSTLLLFHRANTAWI